MDRAPHNPAFVSPLPAPRGVGAKVAAPHCCCARHSIRRLAEDVQRREERAVPAAPLRRSFYGAALSSSLSRSLPRSLAGAAVALDVTTCMAQDLQRGTATSQAEPTDEGVVSFSTTDIDLFGGKKTLGSGGFGNVYRAKVIRGPYAGRDVVVKCLNHEPRTFQQGEVELYANARMAEVPCSRPPARPRARGERAGGPNLMDDRAFLCAAEEFPLGLCGTDAVQVFLAWTSAAIATVLAFPSDSLAL